MSASEDDGSRSGNLHDDRSEVEVSEEEILEYAKFIGIDTDKEPHLRWIAERGVCAPVPPPWDECADGEEIFYFNKNTNESIWEHPCDSKYKRLVKKYRALGPAGAPAPGKERSECSDSEDPVSIVGGSCSGSSRRSSPRSPRSPRADGMQASDRANIARGSRTDLSTPPSSPRSPRSPRVDGGKTSDRVDIVGGSRSGSSRSPRSHQSGSDSPASPRSPHSPHADNSQELGAGSPVGLRGARATQRSAGAALVEDESFASDASGLLDSQSAENCSGQAPVHTGDRDQSKSGSAEDVRHDDGHRNQSPSERSTSSRQSSTGRGARHGDRCLSPGQGSRSPSSGSSHEDEGKKSGVVDNFRRQVSSRSRSPSSRSPSSERRRSSSHGSRSLSPPSRSGSPGRAGEAPAPMESGSHIEDDIPSQPRGDGEAPVSLLSKPTPSETTGAPVDARGLERSKPSNAASATLKTWGQLQTEVRALSDLLEGVRAVRVKQEEYLQRLVSGPSSSTHSG